MPGAVFVSAACLTICCSVSSLHAILTRFMFFASLVTARQRQLSCPFVARISFSTAALIALGEVLSASSSATLEVSITQYSASVMAGWAKNRLARLLSVEAVASCVRCVAPSRLGYPATDAQDREHGGGAVVAVTCD